MKKSEKKQKYRYTTLQNLWYLFSGAFRWRPLIILCTLIFALSEGLKDFVWIYGGQKIIRILENLDAGTHNYKSIIGIVLVAAGIEVLFLLGMEIGRTTASSRITDVRTRFALFINKKLMTMPYALLEDPEVYRNKRKANEVTGNMVDGIEGMLRESASLFARFITMVAAAFILWNLNPLLVVIMFLLAVGRGVVHDRMSKWEKEEFYDPLVPKWHEHAYYFWNASSFEYAKDIRIFQMSDVIGAKQSKILDVIQKQVVTLQNKWKHTLLREEAIGLFQEGIMYVWLIYAVLQKGMSVADFTLYVGSIRSFNNAIGIFLERWTNIVRYSRQTCDFRDFLDAQDQPEEEFATSNFKKDYAVFKSSGDSEEGLIHLLRDGEYEIRFEDVSFSYPGSEQLALKNLNITLESGKRLAVVGLNGAGKSTFIKLLCGLYEPTRGTIYLNGQDIRQFDKNEYFKLIAPVFQNVECFASSIAENVSMRAKEDTDQEKAAWYLQKAGLGEKIESLEKGANTQLLKFLHMDGIELSGGEKQKMVLARALYKDAPIVVLDEPTAALDALAEYKTYMDFDKLIGNKTAVYISHRLSSTRFCHRVAMFEAGQLLEYGTHEELLLAGKSYAKMFEIQSRYYKETEEGVAFNG